jgi:microcystin-dependent protein
MGGTSANRLTDQTGGLDGDTLGDTGGAETHTLTTAQMPSHTHSTTGSSNGGAGFYLLDGADNGAPQTTGSTGGDGAHNNVQPTIILNYIIKT